MQESGCPVCSAGRATRVPFPSRQGDQRFAILECEACSHRYIESPPTDDELAVLYDRYYAQDDRQARSLRPIPRDRALVRTLVPQLPPRARVLEVGCNFGETLLAFPPDYHLEGIDLSASAARAAAANPRLNVRQGFFETEPYAPRSFDCLISLAVIEHVRDPIAFLRKAGEVLRPGGLLVLMTGDYGSWYARRQGEEWSLYHSVGHLHFFSRESLDAALRRAGFAPRDWLWAGPTPLTARLPRPLGRVLHSQTTSLRLPGFQARRRYGSNMYCWAAAGGEMEGRERSGERADARVAVHG